MTNNISVVKKETLFSGLGRMIGAEFLKLRKRQMTWVLLAILTGSIVLVNLILLGVSKPNIPSGNGTRLERIPKSARTPGGDSVYI